jgi:hypothetical protein
MINNRRVSARHFLRINYDHIPDCAVQVPSEREVMQTGLSLEDAKEHCEDPETSSKTATFEGADLINNGKPWFDGFEEE